MVDIRGKDGSFGLGWVEGRWDVVWRGIIYDERINRSYYSQGLAPSATKSIRMLLKSKSLWSF